MTKPGVEHVTLTQQSIDDGSQATQLDQLIADSNQRLQEVEYNVSVQEQYDQIDNLQLPFVSSYQVKYSNGKIMIDESKLTELHMQFQLSNGKVSVFNNSDVYWLVRLTAKAGYQFIYDSVQLVYNQYDKYLYIIVQPGKTLLLPIGIVGTDINVFELPILPFYSQRVTGNMQLKTDSKLDFTTYVFGQSDDLQDEYSFIDQQSFTVDDQSNEFDWQNTKVLTGHGAVKSGYVGFSKYFYTYESGNYVRKTWLVNGAQLAAVSDQIDGYSYARPYTYLNELGNADEHYIDLQRCTFDKLRITFLNGSNGVVTQLTPKRVLYQTDITGQGVTADFIVVQVVNGEVIQRYYQGIQQFGQQYQFSTVPNNLWIIKELSGFSLAESQNSVINLQYAQQQQVFLNTGKPQYLTLQNGTGLMIGGAPDDVIHQFVQQPSELYSYIVQNNSDQPVEIVQFILEYTKVVTPVIQGALGYQYKITLSDRPNFITAYEHINNQNIFCLLQQSIEQQDASQHIMADNQIKIIVEPVDQTDGVVQQLIARHINKVGNQKWSFKPGIVYSTPIDCGVIV